MNGDSLGLAAELKELAEDPAPPMTLDLDRARVVGGRKKRLRTVSLIAGCAAVVVAIGVTVPAVVGHPDAVPPDHHAATPPAVKVDTKRSPLVSFASFGWLPEPIVGVGYTLGSYGDTTVARGVGELPPLIWLSTHDREPEVHDSFGDAVKVPTTVNGRQAYWLTTNERDPLNAGDSYLRWRLENGDWAQIHAYYLDLPDLQQVLKRVASEVVAGERAVPLPLHITSLPENFLITDAMLSRPATSGGGVWELQLSYTTNGANVTIDVRPENSTAKQNGGTCTTANGLDACVHVNRPNAAGLDEIGGAQGLLDRITLLGMDESKWTTEVVG